MCDRPVVVVRFPSKWWNAVESHTFSALMNVVKNATHDHEDRLAMLHLLSEDIEMSCEQVCVHVPTHGAPNLLDL